MSEQDHVLRELNFLGVDQMTVEVLAMLPLLQVAWADGEVQAEEREAILTIAREQYHLGEDGAHLLEGWLSHPPSAAYIDRGRRLLLALAHQRDDFDLKPEHLDDVVEFSKHVAQAAGGFLGFRTVSEVEASAIEDIAAALQVTHHQHVPSDLTEFEEDVEDEDTDVRDPEQMKAFRQQAGIATPDDRELDGACLAKLVHSGEAGPVIFEMDGDGLSIGRSRTNIVQVQHDGQISRVHCKVEVRDGRFYLMDNSTTNGTWVNGERITKRRLYGSEQIAVGDATFTFRPV